MVAVAQLVRALGCGPRGLRVRSPSATHEILTILRIGLTKEAIKFQCHEEFITKGKEI